MIHYCKGDLLKSDVDYIVHQVNCQGKMGSGIAKQIRKMYPEVYTAYIEIIEIMYEPLGFASVTQLENKKHKGVINLFSQVNYGYDGKRYTDYEAFAKGLEDIAGRYGKEIKGKIGIPYNIGCGLGGANWKIISTMIEEILHECDVYVYKLD